MRTLCMLCGLLDSASSYVTGPRAPPKRHINGLVGLEQRQRIGLSSECPRSFNNLKLQVAVCRACLHHSVRAAAQRQRVGQRPDAAVLQRLILELQQRRADLSEV